MAKARRTVDNIIDAAQEFVAKQLTPEQTITAQVLGLPLGASVTPPGPGRRRVTVKKDHTLNYPDLWFDVFIVGSKYDERQFAEMFARSACKRADSIDDADLVVFTGGADVDPSLYNESKHMKTSFNRPRDIEDFNAFSECFEKGVPMFGVCRGAQFLHVMHGGKLYQDIDNHQGAHGMFDLRNRQLIKNVSSVHHQAVRPHPDGGMEILGVTTKSKKRWLNAEESEEGNNRDIEAFFYRDTCSFGVQGHPEYRDYAQYTIWCLQMINDLIMCNPDCHWVKPDVGAAKYRIKADILAQRNAIWEAKAAANPLPSIAASSKGVN